MDLVAVLADALRAAVGPQAAVFALAAVGLNLQFGYAGLMNFGQAGFMLVGGYGMSVSVTRLGAPLWLGILVGLGLGVVLALLLGVPTLRLRGDYLAIATIAAAEILRLLFRSEAAAPLTYGVFGVQQYAGDFYALNPFGAGDYGVGRFSLSGGQLWVAVVGWLLVAAAVGLTALLVHSPWGRVIRAVRNDEEVVRALGKNTYAYKLQALVLGGLMAAVAGMVLALASQAVTPDTYTADLSFYAFAVLLLGGVGRVLGPVVGAVLFWLLIAATDSLLRQAISSGVISEAVLATSEVGPIRLALVGLALILFMYFRAGGLLSRRSPKATARTKAEVESA
ncbi:branched-chain amino acid ABC transporter permease [Modestobacter sp. VKM Ac-2978]|uniref:branched-chain amino acid ABC transporter permease n=1 Tax=Modestobacter sp. VKM Ac-2978 TaxID=3004132 RepID=UPI0022AA2ECD|nr:branched-chain amino acid ABC transporter permease [Modestobacter sp. VKM Ac-2978]MCZ2849114.1 branched-chain amino acid ABC transporter permease [Modestobacter sp. VKM Ac-2978]